jgi:cell division protein FtsI/penicillin-binding protein 2
MKGERLVIEQKPEQNNSEFKKRLKGARIIFFLFFMVIFIYLIKIQVIQHPGYVRRDKAESYHRVKIPVMRGNIYDRNGKALALSVPIYSLYLDSWKIKEVVKDDKLYGEKLVDNLSSMLKLDKKFLQEKLKRPYPLVKEEITLQEYEKLKAGNLPGVVLHRGYKRIYPNDNIASHILGFTRVESKGPEGVEITGVEGTERYYNALLEGKKGESLIFKDGLGRLVPSIEKKLIEPQKGKDLILTIDSNIQFFAEQEIKKALEKWKAKSISVIVMDYENGEILALANKPDYDPNCPGEFPALYRKNRAVADLFEPGSIFKIVTAASAIEEGIFTPADKLFCENGKWLVRNHYLHDVHPYEKLTVEDIIVKSSNIGTVKMALELGEQKLYAYCRKFGFGKPTGVDFPAETAGILRPVEKWSSYSITAVPIGQEVGINALQGVIATSVIANGGYIVKPHLLKEIKDSSKSIYPYNSTVKENIISGRTCDIMKDILRKVVSQEGTAPFASIPGYEICGKTGTAQKTVNGRYSMNKYVASFIGFLRHEKGKFIISVYVDEPYPIHYGGVVAGPVFRNIMWKIVQYKNIPPVMEFEGGKIAFNLKK